MNLIEDKFSKLATEHAPGQEVRQDALDMSTEVCGESLSGIPVDFSHGNVNADAFEPTPGALDEFIQGVHLGGQQAYTEYRGDGELRDLLADRLSVFTGTRVSGADKLIITPGTQGALFLSVASTVTTDDKVAIVQPDYFANRKLIQFMGGQVVPIQLHYLNHSTCAGLDLSQLEAAFAAGVKTFLFSNPSNPTGVVYSTEEIRSIAELANRYGATVIVDQLYSRLLYDGEHYTHLCAVDMDLDNLLTIMGPSKTESLSGYRLGVAFGSRRLIDRMEKLQGIVSLRAPGYSQAVLRTWFSEPNDWLGHRIAQHQAIRDDLLQVLSSAENLDVRRPQAGSYLFPRLPLLRLSLHSFIRVLRQQAGVIVTPGSEFGPHAGDSIRLNFSQNRDAARQAATRIVQMIDRYKA